MNLYSRKKRWKWILFIAAILIVGISLYFTNLLVRKIAKEERKNIQIWADAIHRKASLVNYTQDFFEKLKKEERKRAEILAEAYRNVTRDDNSNESLNFYLKIISGNTTVPAILTDEKLKMQYAVNVDFNIDTIPYLTGKLKKEFSVFEPIKLNYYRDSYLYLFYKDSQLFSELKDVLDDLIQSFFSEVVVNSASVPVIVTDSTRSLILEYGNIPEKKLTDSLYLKETLENMASQNPAIEIEIAGQGKRFIYYQDSDILNWLKIYPYFQFSVIGLFIIIAYVLFSIARRTEQNQVWVGLAKETAHQLGTPISSMMAWVQLLEMENIDQSIVQELKKDVFRLNNIADRFSKIGSEAVLEKHNIVRLITDDLNYLRSRTSQKMKYTINPELPHEIHANVNIQLFDWVIENVIKNAIDATGGEGSIHIDIHEDKENVIIDVTDSGKGIPKSKFSEVFQPGYTSKKRGWGLGLSLAKRIINDYHKGKIFIKSSTINEGTTFRIVLKSAT
jgi:signal transduction histidine kinase